MAANCTAVSVEDPARSDEDSRTRKGKRVSDAAEQLMSPAEGRTLAAYVSLDVPQRLTPISRDRPLDLA